MRITRFAVAPAPLQLLPPSVRRHPEELVSNGLGDGKERNRNGSGTDALPKLLGVFSCSIVVRQAIWHGSNVAYILLGVTS